MAAAPSSRAGTWPQTPTRARAPWERGRRSADPPLRRFPPARPRRGPRENVTGAGQGGVSQATSQVHASSQPGRPGLQRPGAESDETTSAVWRPPAVRRQRPRPRASGRGPGRRQAAGGRPVARARGRGWRSATSAPGRERTRRSARRGAASARESPGRPGLPCRGLGYLHRCPLKDRVLQRLSRKK